MAQGYQALTEKEKQTLRLILRGHDAKSLARHLDLSVHTVNERLRDARRKLQVSSSREAARLLFEREGRDPELLGDMAFGDASRGEVEDRSLQPDALAKAKTGFAWGIAGVVVMSPIMGILALASFMDAAPPSPDGSPSTAAATAQPSARQTEVAAAARNWLALGDEGRWEDGWRATASSFRQANAAARWAQVAAQVRGPLGAVRSRSLLSQDSVPAPPAGVEVVKFRTDFANKADVVETVSLVREDGAWKVNGIYLD